MHIIQYVESMKYFSCKTSFFLLDFASKIWNELNRLDVGEAANSN